MEDEDFQDIQATEELRLMDDDIEDGEIDDAEDECNDIDTMFSYVCALCDDGGDVLSCEGRCLRSFHATLKHGEGSDCKSLGFTQDEVDAIPHFFCKNCEYKQHQCYACGKLGSSDKSSGPEVVSCVSAICGRFYHPHCVAKLLCQDIGISGEELGKKIAMGESFTCPIHKCCVCKEGENKKDHELQFAVCVRCPKSYHKKCFPRDIPFEKEGGLITRAWDGLLPNRTLIYCTKHELGARLRDYIKFPHVDEKKRKRTSEFLVQREKVESTKNKISLEKLYKPFAFMKGSEQVKFGNPDTPDADTKRRLLGLLEDVASSITLKDVIQKHKVPSTHAYSLKNVVDKKISLGKVEGSIEAVRTALLKLEQGGSTEDAEAVCEPEVLDQIFKWKNKLSVDLAPFLYGRRYTSFGRHFTKEEKLEQIADRLHWYVENGDMIVDFCCGANDFSIIMKKKLEETGKKCLYKNFDLIQPKNDFNFEKRDWMTVQREELLTGSRLIMGLNPPFGVKASLANKFIDKALEFKPKLLILIVPTETQRLDEKKSSYDLIWEDNQFLSGKSFYLPGSVDQNDKKMDQWNVKPPPLYLWSHHDWTNKHKTVAQNHGHLSMVEGHHPAGEPEDASDPNSQHYVLEPATTS